MQRRRIWTISGVVGLLSLIPVSLAAIPEKTQGEETQGARGWGDRYQVGRVLHFFNQLVTAPPRRVLRRQGHHNTPARSTDEPRAVHPPSPERKQAKRQRKGKRPPARKEGIRVKKEQAEKETGKVREKEEGRIKEGGIERGVKEEKEAKTPKKETGKPRKEKQEKKPEQHNSKKKREKEHGKGKPDPKPSPSDADPWEEAERRELGEQDALHHRRLGPLDAKEFEMLAHAVYAEARGEPYVGKVAVAAVILNRLADHRFPRTVQGVIFQPLAFEAVADGQIWLEPDEAARRAVKDALGGWDPAQNALYYYNPERATSRWIRKRPQIKRIGQHVFCR